VETSKRTTCFISYSWDSKEHEDWVRRLATDLRRKWGIDAKLDRFHLAPGAHLTKFMVESIRDSDFVLLVCTPNFARKAKSREGGAGFEIILASGELHAGNYVSDTKLVPLLRHGDKENALPHDLQSLVYIDFRNDETYDESLQDS